jgi:predicted alpha-1,2-mannosidase
MNFMILITFLLICLIKQVKSFFTESTKNIKYVNPIIGTFQPPANKFNYGGMIPTTGTPFAMTRFTPMTQENKVSKCPYTYSYSENTFYGFLATHQPAVWMGESAQVAICPGGNDDGKVGYPDRGLTFSHDDEISTPYYYKSNLKNNLGNNIIAELTSTSRASIMRFTFDESYKSPFVIVQATRRGINGEININIEKREISGWNPERQDDNLGPFEAKDFKGYFVVQFDTDFLEYGISHNNEQLKGISSGVGESLGAYVVFPDNVSVVNCRVGVSFISIDQARINMNNEIKENQTLEDISKYTEAKWSEKLDLVKITNSTEDDLAIFYTSMYHSLQYPYEMNEFDKDGVSHYYSGFDNTVHQGEHSYTGYSIWDTFRAEWAFLNLFAPERIDGMIQSMLHVYQEGGRLPMWQNIVETNIMIGSHSSSLIAESLAKGFNNFDLKIAWEALYKDAMVPPDNDLTTQYYDREEGTGCEARAGLTREKELGYVAAEFTSEAGSRTLEYAYDDYTVAVAAEILGYPDDAAFFHERSKSYRNIFNNETNFMEAKYENGKWCAKHETWTEANKWVYTFNVSYYFF